MKNQTIILLPQGWEENTLYLVDVSLNPQNPIWRGMFYSGFLNGENKGPGGYSGLRSLYCGEGGSFSLSEIHYMKVLKILTRDGDREKYPLSYGLVKEG